MEKDGGSWLHQAHLPWQSPNLSPGSVPGTGWQNAFQPGSNPCNNMLSTNESLRGYQVSESPHLKTSQSSQLRGWFYGLPRHRQALTPIPNPVTKGLSEFPCGFNGESVAEAVPRPEEKRFLVFDQSGNQTSLIYSSLVGSYPQQQPCFGNQTTQFDSCGSDHLQMHVEDTLGQIYKTHIGLGENQEIGDESEMHEDTEELNALLYSDDDEDDECEGDEISTGHSPTEMRGYKKEEVEDGEEVASSTGPANINKRKRLHSEENQDLLSLMDTAISGGSNEESEYGNDAESTCVEGMGSLLANNKRLKREKIRETVSILQNIIPGGKGKDAMLVLDEAINYLRSLKLKVKSWEETL